MNLKITEIVKFIFNTEMEIRINDINYGNHLGHDTLISFFHEARLRFFKKMGYTELDVDGSGILITNLLVNYINEAFYADKIKINIGIGEIKRTSINLIYQAIVCETNTEIARALTTITFYDYQRQKVTRIPRNFLSSISSFSIL